MVGIDGSIKTTLPTLDSQAQATKMAADVTLFISTEQQPNALVYHVKMIQVHLWNWQATQGCVDLAQRWRARVTSVYVPMLIFCWLL